jgi:hypothetical protein
VLSLAALYNPFFYAVTYEPPTHGWGLRFHEPAKILNVLILISVVLILTNIERTFRAAVGTMRWRIKFLVIGMGVIFGARVYTESQALLFSDYSPSQLGVETAALLIGCTLMAVAYGRSGFSEIDVYPSRAVLHTSVTVLLSGAYLFVVGVLAQIDAFLAALPVFQSQPLLSCLAWLSWPCCFFLTELSKVCSCLSAAILRGRSMIFVKSGRDSLEVFRLLWMRLRLAPQLRG